VGVEVLTAGAVARRLGIAVTTLRTWHQRYGLGPSHHVPGRHRRYTPEDMDRLQVMRRLTAQGVAPAEAAAWARRVPMPTEVSGPVQPDPRPDGNDFPTASENPGHRPTSSANQAHDATSAAPSQDGRGLGDDHPTWASPGDIDPSPPETSHPGPNPTQTSDALFGAEDAGAAPTPTSDPAPSPDRIGDAHPERLRDNEAGLAPARDSDARSAPTQTSSANPTSARISDTEHPHNGNTTPTPAQTSDTDPEHPGNGNVSAAPTHTGYANPGHPLTSNVSATPTATGDADTEHARNSDTDPAHPHVDGPRSVPTRTGDTTPTHPRNSDVGPTQPRTNDPDPTAPRSDNAGTEPTRASDADVAYPHNSGVDPAWRHQGGAADSMGGAERLGPAQLGDAASAQAREHHAGGELPPATAEATFTRPGDPRSARLPAVDMAWPEQTGRLSVARDGGGLALHAGRAGPAARGFARAAMRLDGPAVRDILEMIITDRGVVPAWEEVIMPVLVGIGERYAATHRFIEVEHLISRGITEVLGAVTRPPSTLLPRVLLAAADEEQHTLPLEALAAALAQAGVPSRFLGARLPPRALSDAVTRTGPAAVVLWSQMPSTGDPAQWVHLLSGPHRPVLAAAAGPGWPVAKLPEGVTVLGSLAEAVRLVSMAALPAERAN